MFDLADDLPGGVTPAQTIDATEKAVTADEKRADFRKPPKNPEQVSALSPAPPGGCNQQSHRGICTPFEWKKIQYSEWVARSLLTRAGVTAKAPGGLGTEFLAEVCISSAGALGKMGVWESLPGVVVTSQQPVGDQRVSLGIVDAYLHVLADRLDFRVPPGELRNTVRDRLVTGSCA